MQRPSTAFAVLIESRRAPADVRTTVQDAVRRTDPTRPVPLLRRVNDLIGASLEPRRVSVIVAAAFAALALMLACLGVYGVISFAVASRAREIGIRVAVGAAPVRSSPRDAAGRRVHGHRARHPQWRKSRRRAAAPLPLVCDLSGRSRDDHERGLDPRPPCALPPRWCRPAARAGRPCSRSSRRERLRRAWAVPLPHHDSCG